MKLIVALFLAGMCLSLGAQAKDPSVIDDIPDFVVKPLTRSTLAQLREGGYVLYMRHGKTDTARPDQLPLIDLNDCSKQRPLTEAGRQEAAWVGRQIRKARIPLGEVFSSPMCRAKETALAAFGQDFTLNTLLMFTADMTDRDKGPVLEATRELLSRPVAAGSNRVLVAHSQNIMELIGYLPQPESVIVIFKPQGEKRFKYIASMMPTQWKALTSASQE